MSTAENSPNNAAAPSSRASGTTLRRSVDTTKTAACNVSSLPSDRATDSSVKRKSKKKKRAAVDPDHSSARDIIDIGLDESQTQAASVEKKEEKKEKKDKKKRAAADPDSERETVSFDKGNDEAADGVLVDEDTSEPTMGEKLARLNLLEYDKSQIHEQEQPSVPTMPPSADSVHVLLRQALHADDRSLMLDCLYTKDEKVILKSISLLNPADVLKLLHFLISIIQSRGAILACALPWLRNLLLQHASRIMSQESSLLALNSLYQLIESRVSTFESALQLSTSLDLLYRGVEVFDEDVDENETIIPVIYEDKDESDEYDSEDAMETDQHEDEDEEDAVDNISDVEVGDGMSE